MGSCSTRGILTRSRAWYLGVVTATAPGGLGARQIHGINLLPITSASVYLAQIPERTLSDISARENAAQSETAAQTDGTPSVIWENVFVSWMALNDPELALAGGTLTRTVRWSSGIPVAGRSRGCSREALRHTDLSVTADTMMYGVFVRGDGKRTYCAYNAAGETRSVEFSDGVVLQAAPNDLTCD